MNACIDGRSAAPGATGIGAFARCAAEALAAYANGDHLTIISTDGAPLPDYLKPAESVSLVKAPSRSPLWGELELPVLLEEQKVDVFFSPLFTCPVVRGTRQVITLHDVFPESHQELCTPEFKAFWRARLGPSLRSACHAVAVSGWSKSMATGHLRIPPERISVVGQTVGERFRPVPDTDAAPTLNRYGLGGTDYVFYVGAIDPRKNLENLVRAVAGVREVTLVIAGRATVKGYDLDRVAQEAGVAERVRLIGYIPDEELPTLYSHARCFAFPSLAEGFGRPCIEAMSCGVPVVASNRTALPGTCGEAALLPDPEDVKGLTAALETACFDEKARKRLVEAGRERAAEFTPARFAADLFRAFEAALAGPGEGLWTA